MTRIQKLLERLQEKYSNVPFNTVMLENWKKDNNADIKKLERHMNRICKTLNDNE